MVAFWEVYGSEERSSNVRTSFMKTEEADRIVAAGRLFVEAGSEQTSVVITPYAGQRNLRQKMIGSIELTKVGVLPFDAFQSREAPFVIFSFVCSSSFSKDGFVDDVCRLKVALTRLIGNTDTLGSSGLFRRFIRHPLATPLFGGARLSIAS